MILKMFYFTVLCAWTLLGGAQALYPAKSDVVELTPSNFDRLVINGDEVWIVEFYAPWCGHCKKAKPEYSAAARHFRDDHKVAVGFCL